MQPDPDRDGQPVVQGQRQRAVFGGKRVGPAGVDDGDRAEQIVDRVSRRTSTRCWARPLRVSGRLGLAQRAQHVLAQRRGVLGAGQPGARHRRSAPRSDPPAGRRRRRSSVDDGVVEAGRASPGVVAGLRRAVDRRHGRASAITAVSGPRHRQPGADGRGQRGQDAPRVVGPQIPDQRRQRGSGCAARRRAAAPRHSIAREGVLAASDGTSRAAAERPGGVRGRTGATASRARAGQRRADGGVERRDDHLRRVAVAARGPAVGGRRRRSPGARTRRPRSRRSGRWR